MTTIAFVLALIAIATATYILIDHMNGIDVPVTDKYTIRYLKANGFTVSHGYLRLNAHEIKRATKTLGFIFENGSLPAMHMLNFMYTCKF